MIDLDNQTTLPLNLEILEDIASSLTTSQIELLIVDDETMQGFNSTHRGKESSTDVLSFPIDSTFSQVPMVGFPLGSIVISANYVEQKAQEYGHTAQDELCLLFIHGLLHLLGFDHEVDHGEMRAKETEMIEAFDLPKSLIIRTGE